MPEDSALRAIAAHLSPSLRPLLELAREEARFRFCFFVGIEHLFVALVKNPDGRLADALASLGAEPKPVRDHVRRFAGAGGGEEPFAPPVQPTPRLQAIARAAADFARGRNVEGAEEIDLVRALFADPDASPSIVLALGGLDLDLVVAAMEAPPGRKVAAAAKGERNEMLGRRSILGRFGRDLTALASAGKLGELIGRDREIREILRALCRQTKNAPLLIGEPGVGKSAVVEGLAVRIARGEVPAELSGRHLVEISLSGLVAGTKYRGEFEERMEGLVREVREDPDVLLFIDEIHQLVGAGRGEGAMDAGDILKPALARGEITVVGATTPAEYAKSIEKDGALARRFQTIRIEEPSPEEAKGVLAGRLASLGRHHGVRIEPDALDAAVDLSVRYLPDRRLPDKAIDLLDEACARLRVRSHAGPAATFDRVGAEEVAEALAEKTGLSVQRLTEGESERLLHLEEALGRRIVGQEEACRIVAEKIRLARAGLGRPRRPVGVFLFLGPSGVGKTELAKALAALLMGTEKDLVRVDMSEYGEKFNVSRLIGSPPGYVGSEEEGQLTGPLRRRPASVVLLDEIEKAHPEVWNLFLQVFDDGRLTDSQGRVADCTNAVFVMTSNVGSDLWRRDRAAVGFGTMHRPEGGGAVEACVRPSRQEVLGRIRKIFRPEFLNRIDEIVLFDPLGPSELVAVARIELAAVVRRLEERGIRIEVTEAALREIAGRGLDPAEGARPIARAVEERIARPLSTRILGGEIFRGCTVRVDCAGGELRFERVDEGATPVSGSGPASSSGTDETRVIREEPRGREP
jgi:ATP-dependent Clp protease ATP-binding subunit ClpC